MSVRDPIVPLDLPEEERTAFIGQMPCLDHVLRWAGTSSRQAADRDILTALVADDLKRTDPHKRAILDALSSEVAARRQEFPATTRRDDPSANDAKA